MDRARSAVFRHGRPRVRDWPIWSESKPLIALLSGRDLRLSGLDRRVRRSTSTSIRPNLVLFAALLACVAFSVEMSRRASEPDGVVKDVYAVWELPMVFLLPGLYALIVPAIRLTLTPVAGRAGAGVPPGLHRGDDRHRLRLRAPASSCR